MSKIRMSLLTIDGDSADPGVMTALRDLLERFGAGSVVMAPAAAPAAEHASAVTSAAQELGRRGGEKGGHARAEALSDEERTQAARHAAKARWSPEPEAAVTAAPPATSPALVEREARASSRLDGETRILEPESPAAVPTGRVEGFVAQARELGSLQERLLAAVEASPGVTIPNLTASLLGESSSVARRRIDMTAGPLVMEGRLVRLNGALYPKGYRGPVAKHEPAKRAAAAPPAASSATDKEAIYSKIIAAFTKDPGYPLGQLSEELFGDSVGHTYAKLQLMLRQLVASERLERVGHGEYRPWSKAPKRERDSADDDDTESNGAPDDDALEELDLS